MKNFEGKIIEFSEIHNINNRNSEKLEKTDFSHASITVLILYL